MIEADRNSKIALKDYARYTSEVNLRNSKVACQLVIALMPAGIVLDYFVYPHSVPYFLALRLSCSALTFLVWLGLRYGKLTDRHAQVLSMGWYILPSFFISWMIAAEDGPTSPYYAGLNLVILAASSVIQATLVESIKAVAIIIGLYLGACALNTSFQEGRIFVNNLYFLVLTAIIVVTGNLFFNRLRFREFTLRHELDQNKRELESSNRKLVELDQVKSRFFANISHELRTPLTLLLAPLETLLNRFKTSFNDQARNMLVTMHSNGMRLLKLINDLLDLVRLDSGVLQVKREPVEVSNFIKGLASAARQVADDKRIQMDTDVANDVGVVMLDRDKLEKVVLNLQFNALKFTPAGGRVTIRGTKQGDTLVLKVEDTGMGISANNLPHVFDRFWQADGSSKRKYQGVGIGLALVKELVEVQDGSVSVESQEGVGTIFTVSLPYLPGDLTTPTMVHPMSPPDEATEEAAPMPPATVGTVSNQEWLANLYRRAELFPSMTSVQESVRPAGTARNGTHPQLLVADDEPDMLQFIKSQLEEHYQIIEAVDGQQAIDKASQFLPDIILLDMMMPEKDGLQACREIRVRTSTRNIPIILLTARADEETKLAALEAGASDFLPKPFSTTELHVRIKNLVESFQYQRKLSKQNQLLESTVEQLKETETLLVQTEKLASLGRLSAGIIHEINNPLNFATTGLFTLRKIGRNLAPEQKQEYDEILHDVEEGVGRVKTIVSDLRSFSHHENDYLDHVPVENIVTSALRFLSHEWKDKVNIEQTIPDGLSLYANKNKMIQVFVNLIQNSLDAIEEKNFRNEHPAIWIEGREENGHCILIVRDNGEGIKPEVMDKIFDPFFTTKDVGDGMGLGLSICYQIIQGFEGHVAVKSDPGKYCEFKLDFPSRR
jgi:signal transduction histidine kinase